jgi:hypothetical protein
MALASDMEVGFSIREDAEEEELEKAGTEGVAGTTGATVAVGVVSADLMGILSANTAFA